MRIFTSIFLILPHLINSALSVSIPDTDSEYSRDAFSTPRAALVNLRVEGKTTTVFEGFILTNGHNVTTPSGGTHICDGTNLNANPTSGPTVTSALDDAARKESFTWDGTWYPSFEDFFITRIANDTGTSSAYWGLLVNYQYTPVGGCQQRVRKGDEILIAYVPATGETTFLKLASSRRRVRIGENATFTVTDGATGAPVADAVVEGRTTDVDGKVVVSFGTTGVRELKAIKTSSIRSNVVKITVV